MQPRRAGGVLCNKLLPGLAAAEESRADLRPLHPITITRDAAPALPALSDDRIFP